jgi:hypothetical protein
MPLPSGTLYNMRALVDAGTLDGSSENLKVSLFTSASRKAFMTCGVSVPHIVTCSDLTDTVTVNAGDRIYATVGVPDSNTELNSVAISVEETIIE